MLNTFCNVWSKPPSSSSPSPIVHFPSFLSGSKGSGSRLSSLQDRPSLKQKGRILNGGNEAATNRRQSFRYRSAPQSVDPERGGCDVAMTWKASQRYGECLRNLIRAPLRGRYILSVNPRNCQTVVEILQA